MLKNFSVVILLIIFNLQSEAQNFIGPIMGLSIATWSDLEESNGVTTGFKAGINIGAAFEMDIDSNFSIQPELRFTQMGTIEKFDFGAGEEKATLSINYLTIPILAKYRFGMKPSQFFILAGPRLGFGVGDVTLEAGGQSGSQSFEDAEVSKFDFGLEVGAGVRFKLGTANMFIDARYYLGLQNLNSGNLPGNAKNTAIGINVGYLFSLAK